MGAKRRKVKFNKVSRYKSRNHGMKQLPIWILAVIAAALAIIIFLIAQTAFFYLTESGTDPDNPYPVKGIDVSAYQKEIDWDGIKGEDIAFAFVKATEGSSHVDSNFKTNWEGARSAGIATGAYHFLSFDSEASRQAENYIKTVPKKWSALPPVVDVELYGGYTSNPPSADLVREKLDIVLQRLEKRYHKTPIIYTNGYLYGEYISGYYDEYSIWISDPEIPDKLSDGSEWTFCQYTFKGYSKYVAGGEKYVDFDVFNGTKWDFRKYR